MKYTIVSIFHYKLKAEVTLLCNEGGNMEISFEKRENIDMVNLIGRLDGNTVSSVKDEIMDKLNEKTNLIIDMKNCEYVSSAGLRILMIIAKTLRLKGGNGALVEMNEEVGDVMEMTGFGNVFRTFNTVDEAIEFLQKGGKEC